MVLSLLASCDAGSGNNHSLPQGDTIPVRYAANLTMVDHGDFIKADFRNPWDTARTLQTFLLVPRQAPMPQDMPHGTVVKVPLQRSIVNTSAHNGLIDELGAIDAVVGAWDTRYILNPRIRRLVESGAIADCGSSMTPDIERMLQLRPDAILLSAFENSADHNKVARTGVPVIDCVDYMETSPLARAEWMKFFGRLYGKGQEADSLFDAVERQYMATKALVKDVTTRPSVLTEQIYGQAWSIPGAYSTIGVLIEDAGGTNPFATYKTSGSVMLAPEEVLYKAGDADIWLLKYALPAPPELSALAKDHPIYSKFKAWADGNVYGCDTGHTTYFDDEAFHPHWILAEYVNMIHPEIGEAENDHHYYKKLEK